MSVVPELIFIESFTVSALVFTLAVGVPVPLIIKSQIGALLFIFITGLPVVLASPICNCPPVTVEVEARFKYSAFKFELDLGITMAPPDILKVEPVAPISKDANAVLVFPCVETVILPPD